VARPGSGRESWPGEHRRRIDHLSPRHRLFEQQLAAPVNGPRRIATRALDDRQSGYLDEAIAASRQLPD
jgi:hypothetical protein